jgi:uncharacterized membrane protein YidH (DUF202 family)
MAMATSYQRAAIEAFLKSLPADAPIRSVVASAGASTQIDAYETADARAMAAQARYRAWGRRGLRATTFGILIGALLLLPLDQWFAGTPRTVVGALQTLALVITFGATLFIMWLKPLDQWMSHRAEAEQLRGKIFAAILNGAAPAGADPAAVAKQKLDLLMAAHINDQLHFFDKRTGEHKKLASNFSPVRLLGYLLIVGAAALGMAALINGLGVPIPDPLRWLVDLLVLPDANRWQLGIATMASGVLAHATAHTLMEEDLRKAALYAVTAKKLRRLIDRDLPEVKAATANGDETTLRKYFVDARAILEQEHAVWSFIRPSEDEPG